MPRTQPPTAPPSIARDIQGTPSGLLPLRPSARQAPAVPGTSRKNHATPLGLQSRRPAAPQIPVAAARQPVAPAHEQAHTSESQAAQAAQVQPAGGRQQSGVTVQPRVQQAQLPAAVGASLHPVPAARDEPAGSYKLPARLHKRGTKNSWIRGYVVRDVHTPSGPVWVARVRNKVSPSQKPDGHGLAQLGMPAHSVLPEDASMSADQGLVLKGSRQPCSHISFVAALSRRHHRWYISAIAQVLCHTDTSL